MKTFAAGLLMFVMSLPLQAQNCVAVSREVYLMGTTATLSSCAPTRESGLAQLEAFLTILEETEQELSTWIQDSPISRLNRTPVGERFPLNARLTSLFRDLFEWSAKTGGAFDPAVGPLTAVWGIHENGRRPASHELEAARARSGMAQLEFSAEENWIARKRDVTIDVGAFGKGEGLDRVAAYARTHPVDPFLIDLGGQILAHGGAWPVDLAHPVERRQPALSLKLASGSLSTSSGSERDVYLVDGERIGHHVDPRTGQTIISNLSVSVWHERALIADMLTTALFVMGAEAGLAWAEAHEVAACFLIPAGNGKLEIRNTRAWSHKNLSR